MRAAHLPIGMSAVVLLILALSLSPARASTYQVIYTAPAGQTFHPAIGGINRGLIYGVDPTGGTSGQGLLFTISGSGQFTPLYTFSGSNGAIPNARLVFDANGTVYGTTQGGGSTGAGTVFAISAQGKLLLSHSMQTNTEGATPLDGLAVGPGNSAYATTSEGAISPGNGTLFRIGPSGTLTVAYSFRSTPIDGHCPFTGVVIDNQGTIFGTTVGLGFGGQPNGSVWKIPLGMRLSTIHSFTNGTDGEYPTITPTLDAEGNLWGVSQTNVFPYAGSIWAITSSGFNVMYVFTGNTDGDGPNGPLLLGNNKNLYGTTTSGGIAFGNSGLGTIYTITPQGALTTVHAFTGGADGAVPTGSLAMGPSGEIYGGTQAGTIFRVTP